jgi:regulator of protease activity HflC (stomatin/prohibitin superfamily)
MSATPIVLIVLAAVAVVGLLSAIRIVREYERVVVFRLGRLRGARGPGLVLIIPLVERTRWVNLQVDTADIPPQDLITKDNVTVRVEAAMFFRVVDPVKAVVEIRDYQHGVLRIAQTTLRATLGQHDLDDLLANQATINELLKQIIDSGTEPWGINVVKVETKDVDLPDTMKRAMARQAEAERERRAKVIAAEGEFQAAGRLSQAAGVISRERGALTLRTLQTLAEVATEHNSTLVFPIPMDVLDAVREHVQNGRPGAFASPSDG